MVLFKGATCKRRMIVKWKDNTPGVLQSMMKHGHQLIVHFSNLSLTMAYCLQHVDLISYNNEIYPFVADEISGYIKNFFISEKHSLL